MWILLPSPDPGRQIQSTTKIRRNLFFESSSLKGRGKIRKYTAILRQKNTLM
jgi:hypothetical protein